MKTLKQIQDEVAKEFCGFNSWESFIRNESPYRIHTHWV